MPITKLDIPSQENISYDYSGLSIGTEFATSNHVFQIFVSNYNNIVPQQNAMKNINSFGTKDILIGFNITRRYNF